MRLTRLSPSRPSRPAAAHIRSERATMTEVTRFKTPSGDEMVVLPATEYRRLVDALEMAEDVAAYDEFQRKLAAGEDELIPAEIVDRILAGEYRVRVWREHRGMSVKSLAEAAGVTPAYLSQVET